MAIPTQAPAATYVEEIEAMRIESAKIDRERFVSTVAAVVEAAFFIVLFALIFHDILT